MQGIRIRQAGVHYDRNGRPGIGSCSLFMMNGAGGRNRTGTMLPSGDFESPASTNFTTPALWPN